MARARYYHSIVTTGGTDGACCAAALLMRHSNAAVHVTSQNAVHFALGNDLYSDPRPDMVYVCGVGIVDNLSEVLERLGALRVAGSKVSWYCGRGYMNEHKQTLDKVCTTVFGKASSNTELVARHLKLPRNKRLALLLELAREYANKKTGPKEHLFWHDLIQAASNRYFQFGEEDMFLRSLRKLAGLLPVNRADQDEVAYFRKAGSRSGVSLGTSRAMDRLREHVRRLAPLDEPVLVLGPSGSGKELVARALHAGSPRRHERFYPVNCAILGTNPDLAYDRLFGHVAGAYTSATGASPGAFEAAGGGSLFLDEVAELPPPVQTQLLRVLEEKTISPLGTVDSRPVDVRVIAATNRDLPSLVGKGLFRLDLYYRLNVLPIEVPPLKDRIEDANPIAGSILSELRAQGHSLKLTDKDWNAIRSYEWPGNVRQFSNLLKRAAYLKLSFTDVLDQERRFSTHAEASDRSAEAKALHLFLPRHKKYVSPESEIRSAYMRHVLDLFDGNWSQACKALGVSDNTLRSWIARDRSV